MKKLFLLLVLSSFYSFSQDSLNVQKPKLSVIALDKIKVVYRGISNPISIGVLSNVKSFIVSGPGVSTTDIIGKYNVRPGSGNELTIKVQMTFFDNSVVVEEHVYKIKGLPAPIGTLNKEYATKGYLEFTKEELKDAIVGIKMVDFAFNINLEVREFSIKIPRFPTLVVTGNVITKEVYELVKKARKKDIIVISEIKGNYLGIDQFIKYPVPIIFKIIK